MNIKNALSVTATTHRLTLITKYYYGGTSSDRSNLYSYKAESQWRSHRLLNRRIRRIVSQSMALTPMQKHTIFHTATLIRFFLVFFHYLCPVVPLKPEWAKGGRQTYKKALSQRLICGCSNLANSISPHDKAMVNVHGFVYSCTGVVHNVYTTRIFQTIRSLYTYSVGFGIAYPWRRAMREPEQRDERWVQIPALFLYGLWLI